MAGGVAPPKPESLPISEYKRHAVVYCKCDFYEILSISGLYHDRLEIQIWGICIRGSVVMGILPQGCIPPHIFSDPSSELCKLCVGFEDILNVQKWYGPPLLPCQVWWD